jgi:periplasmic protein TonB
MKKYLLLAVFVTTAICSYAQIDSSQEKVFNTVQVEAQFPGGTAGWRTYLQTNLKASLGSKYLKPKEGQTIRQNVIVSFLVDKEGNIQSVRVENPKEVHPRLAEESIRVIEQGPKWIPATQNGRNVIYRQKQSIIWQATYEY